ncbi:DUF3613 domain-containing protein [Pseudomonas resinovorans]|uniref:DUF3613 domain-containing protein n=1 Tax=Metapseudomonas resinovorans TaxID=53412 RepID=UPI00237F88AE|nr:DUF3613 domain-containing protein [Pseudomonas resinovorans]MDE3737418.1 DUF3613 domain-containing protein [Pseudomonas resinovorans]
MNVWITILLLGACCGLQAAEDPRHARHERQRQSEQWLSIQREGSQASRHAQSATPAERELANQRWLESYKYAIPERYYGNDPEPGGSSSGQ